MQLTNEKNGPSLWPLTLVLGLLLWIFATTGGRQIFVKEMLGSAYDSQAEHFLRGDVNVDGEDIRHEALVVNGNSRMYFGPFPAVLRMPLNFIYPAGRGAWSRISGFIAATIALVAFAKLLADSLRSSALSVSARRIVGNACLAGLALGSPLFFFLGNLSIYNEATIWGLAWSFGALFFACRASETTERGRTLAFLGFSLCAAFALHSRVTFGLPFLLIALLLAIVSLPEKRLRDFAAIFLPIGLGFALYLLLSYARFGTLLGINFDDYINPTYREFAHKHGVFSLRRVPCGLMNYLHLGFPRVQAQAPFFLAERHIAHCPSLYSLPVSEAYLSVIWGSGWLVLGAIGGMACLLDSRRTNWIQRGMAAAFLAQFILILSYFSVAQRFSADLYPFLIFCFLVFLRTGGGLSVRARYALIGLVVLSIAVNSLTTISWLVDADQNVTLETRAAWNALLGRGSPL